MTCREKLNMENQNAYELSILPDRDPYPIGCPSGYGYLDDPPRFHGVGCSITCDDCWNREIPEKGVTLVARVKRRTFKTNGEGYSDPTAYRALKKVHEDERLVSDLIRIAKEFFERNGFHVENRIVLKNKHTGKIWR